MGDPISIAGSTVGIISLGIQVCNGLLVYADAVQGREQYMIDRNDDVRSLLALFKSLESVIGRITAESPKNASSLLEHLGRAEAKLKALEELLKEFNVPVNTPASLKGKMKETCRGTIYPIKKPKLENARHDVQALLTSLTTALQAVGLDLGVSQNDILKKIQSAASTDTTELKTSIEANARHLHEFQLTSKRGLADLNHGLNSAQKELQVFSKFTLSQLNSIEEHASEGVGNTCLILKKLEEISSQLERSVVSSSRRVEYHNLVQDRQLVSRPTPQVQPTSLKQACDRYTIDPDLLFQSVGRMNGSLHTETGGAQMSCKCFLLPRKRRGYLAGFGWSVYLEQVGTSPHNPCCPFAKSTKTRSVIKTGAELRFQLGSVFAALIEVSLGFTTGAEGLTLSSSLQYRNVISDGPVKRLMRNFTTELRQTNIGEFPLQARLQLLVQQITTCFECGKASPSDVISEFGEEAQYYMFFILVVWNLVKMRFDEQDLKLVLDIARWLAEVGGSVDSEEIEFCWMFLSATMDRHLDRSHDLLYASDLLLLTWIMDVAEPEDDSFGNAWVSTLTSCPTAVSHSSLSRLVPWMHVSPIAKAIMSRSMNELNLQIELAPESVMGLTFGHTTLEMAHTWAPGLKRLLQTQAQILLHQDSNCTIDLFRRCGAWKPDPQVLDLLLDGGMSFFPERYSDSFFPDGLYDLLRYVLGATTTECVQIIAKHLAQKLRSLSELAFNAGVVEKGKWGRAGLPDLLTAARLCDTIEGKGVSIDPAIRVPVDDHMFETIYHCESLPLDFFPVFYEHGFTHLHTPNQLGLPPIFATRPRTFRFHPPLSSDNLLESDLGIFKILPWLSAQGLLAQKPYDPLNLGVNTHATGTHYIASQLGANFMLRVKKQQECDLILRLTTNILQNLAQDSSTDDCVCWCNLTGEGCSPLKLLYKSHTHWKSSRGIRVWLGTEFQQQKVKDLLFNFDMFTPPTDANSQQKQETEVRVESLTTRALELLRLLTFEALEMTHTCCMFERLRDDGFSFGPCYIPEIIFRCDPTMVQNIRQDPSEQKNSVLLDALMGEFSDYLNWNYRQGSFLEFISGYWQERMKKFYALQEEEVQNMKHYLNNVQTSKDTQVKVGGLYLSAVTNTAICRHLALATPKIAVASGTLGD